jgi:hypothetical protein
VPETEEAYQQKKKQLSELATLLHEAVIGTRWWQPHWCNVGDVGRTMAAVVVARQVDVSWPRTS